MMTKKQLVAKKKGKEKTNGREQSKFRVIITKQIAFFIANIINSIWTVL